MAEESIQVSIPYDVLKSMLGSIVTIETKTRYRYCGYLVGVNEDNMNCNLINARQGDPDGQNEKKLDEAFIRGSDISMIIMDQSKQSDDIAERTKKHYESLERGRGDRGRGGFGRGRGRGSRGGGRGRF